MDRMRTYEVGPDEDGGEFHAHAFLNGENQVVGYSQGSVMRCGEGGGMVYFWQYGVVNEMSRGKGVSKLFHLVNDSVLRFAADRKKVKSLGEIWETEPKGLGVGGEEIKFTKQRLQVHCRAGGRIMLGVSNDGEFFNLHIQPRLTKDSQPIELHLMYRSNASVERVSIDMAKDIVIGFFDNFRREGVVDLGDIAEAQNEIENRLKSCHRIVLLDDSQVPDVVTLAETNQNLENQIFGMYGVDTLAQARAYYELAMGS